MWHNFLYLVLSSALFLNTDAASYLGVGMLTTAAFTPLIVAAILRGIDNRIELSREKHGISFLILVFTIVILVTKIMNDEDVLRILVNFTVIPLVVIPVAFYNVDKREKQVFRNALLFFYAVECSLAILERVLSRRFFDTIFVSDRYDIAAFEQYTWQFRSTSLLGHPLENAMAVAVMMTFILLSSLKFNKRIFLFLLGYVALFCFNARGAIIVCSFLLLPILYKQIVSRYKRYRLLTSIALIAVSICGSYLLLNSSLSGRLFNTGRIIDDSAQERLNVFSYLDYLPSEKLITGDLSNYGYLLDRLGLVGIENGIITTILLYGFLFGIPLLMMLFYFSLEKLRPFGRQRKIVVLLIFWGIGMMNPNLVDPTQWYILIFCLIAFKPETYFRRKFSNQRPRPRLLQMNKTVFQSQMHTQHQSLRSS